jgi:hypothetical protein
LNKINKNRKFVLLAFVSVFLLSATFGNSFVTEAPWQKTTSSDSFPQAGKFYTLAGRTFNWETVGGKNVTTGHSEEIHKWSIQDVVGNVALVNRTYVESYIQLETGVNYTSTWDIDYQIATNRTILSAYWKTMTFTTKGYSGSSERPLDEDIDEHTWGWFPINLSVGTYVLVSWTTDNNFPNDMLYQVVGEEVIEVLSDRQDCWMVRMPPSVTLDGTQGRTETYWVDKDTGIPLKLYSKGWALDESFGWEDEDVLVHTNIDLGPESTQPPMPTYTLTVPTTPGFPDTGKFYTWYYLVEGWFMSGATNITYYEEGLTVWLIAEATDDVALVYRTQWVEHVDVATGELENVVILDYNYSIDINTREIMSIAGSVYRINMTSLTYTMEDRTSGLLGDIGEETYCWLPTNVNIGSAINMTWTGDWSSSIDNATYTVINEKIVNTLGNPQASWILHMPITPSIDGTWNYTETWCSDKDVGIPLGVLSEGWAVDGNEAYIGTLSLIDTNVDIGPSTYYLTITSAAEGTTNPLPGTYNYTGGSSHNVTAIPNSGYSFNYWLLDGIEKTENPITIVIDANHTLKAFFIDDIPPEIGIPMQEPPENVTRYQSVTVTVNVTDLGTGVYNVTLWYIIVNNGTPWMPLNMTEISANTYHTAIPGYENGTWVIYKIVAYDNNGNPAATDDIYGYHYVYPVISEFQTATIMPLFMIATLLTIIVYKRKQE